VPSPATISTRYTRIVAGFASRANYGVAPDAARFCYCYSHGCRVAAQVNADPLEHSDVAGATSRAVYAAGGALQLTLGRSAKLTPSPKLACGFAALGASSAGETASWPVTPRPVSADSARLRNLVARAQHHRSDFLASYAVP
jgi:hypothetical protein